MAVEIPQSVLTLKKRTRVLYLSWWITHYAVGLSGVVAGALLTALTSAQGKTVQSSLSTLDNWTWLIGIIAAVCTSLVTFLGPIHKAERYWSAYHLLDQGCLEYEEGQIALSRFLLIVKQARRILQAIDGETHQANAAITDLHRKAEHGDESIHLKRNG